MHSISSHKIPDHKDDRLLQILSLNRIETIFLDMDGTLLDKYFDDFFWEHYVIKTYSSKNRIGVTKARDFLFNSYKKVENTLQWTDLSYWSNQLDLDIVQMKHDLRHLINIHPYAKEFLRVMKKKGKKLYLITNAHPDSLHLKMDKLMLTDWFDKVVTSQDVGFAKEQYHFWDKLTTLVPYDKNCTLFVDDTERVLDAAAEYGIKHLLHIAKPSSKQPPNYSKQYPSITNFSIFLRDMSL